MVASILNTICDQRHKDVAAAKEKVSLEQLKSQIDAANKEFPVIDFMARLREDSVSGVAVVAEIKRASPSKGDIAPGIVAGEQGVKYANAGCSGISVLTEPTWFKGTLDDMRDVRTKVASMARRPAILRKDFLIDEYMVYEGRVYGADTVLLIVAVLEEALLTSLISTSRSLGMEPLVEVNNDNETKIALRAGAKIIGVNNRNLHDFKVDASTTEQIMATHREELEAKGCMLCALSGIQNRVDVQRYQVLGVEMVLVGEALMRSTDAPRLIRQFRGLDDSVLVKTCGFKDVEGAIHAAKAGADFIGLVFAKGSPREVSVEGARAIIDAIRYKKCHAGASLPAAKKKKHSPRFTAADMLKPRDEMLSALRAATAVGPLFVGVFSDQSAEEVKGIAEQTELDIIQLSGHEGWANLDFYHPYAVINAEHVAVDSTSDELLAKCGAETEALLLLDTKHPAMTGGTGIVFDWQIAKAVQKARPMFTAGGLGPDNVAQCVVEVNPMAVDASSGMEKVKGVKDPELVYKYVHNAKNAKNEKDLIKD